MAGESESAAKALDACWIYGTVVLPSWRDGQKRTNYA
jgi:hypothetical protein